MASSFFLHVAPTPALLGGARIAGIDGLILVLTVIVAAATARSVARFPKRALVPGDGEGLEASGDDGRESVAGALRQWSTRAGVSSMPDRLPAFALLLTGLPLTWAGARLLAGTGSAVGGVAVSAVGAGVIAWLSAACREDADRPLDAGVETDGGVPQVQPQRLLAIVLPRAGGFRRGALLALPLASALFVWTDQRARGADAGHGDIVRLWLVGMVAAVVAVAWPLRWRMPSVRDLRARRWRGTAGMVELGGLIAVGIVATALRFWRLDGYPWIFSGDEGQFGLSARRVIAGMTKNPFSTGWFSHPNLYFFLQAGSMRIFGENVDGIRALTALLGVASVVVTALYARRMFGAGVGIVAGFFAATFHFHLLYSRIALNNVGDMLFLPLMLWLIDRGIGGRRRVDSLLAGITIGLGQYFFFGARLLPLVAIVVIVATALDSVGWQRGRFDEAIRSVAPYTLLLVFGAVVAATPFLANYIDHKSEVLARQRQVSVFSSGWLRQEGLRTGQSAVEVVIRQVWHAALVPFHTVVSGTYAPPAPLPGSLLVIPIAIGLGIVASRCRRRRYVGLAAAWAAVTIGLALTQGTPPESNRYVSAAPLLPIFAAIGLVAVHQIVVRLVGAPKRLAMVGTAVIVATICLWNVRFFFNESHLLAYYSGENTQVANTLAYEIRPMGSDIEVYFAGPPRMWYDGFANIAFIAPDANGLSIEQPWTAAQSPPILIGRSLFVFLPERAGELGVVRAWFPGGESRNVTSATGQPLYTEYLVDPAPPGEVLDS